MAKVCIQCGFPTQNADAELCNNCWEVMNRLDNFLKNEKNRQVVQELLKEYEKPEQVPTGKKRQTPGTINKADIIKFSPEKINTEIQRIKDAAAQHDLQVNYQECDLELVANYLLLHDHQCLCIPTRKCPCEQLLSDIQKKGRCSCGLYLKS